VPIHVPQDENKSERLTGLQRLSLTGDLHGPKVLEQNSVPFQVALYRVIGF
jgi:hypothetical protein